MGKISPVSIKYIIYAKFEAKGVVEKPDVIGAVFGQTEGLLGEDLELRELQKNGKIGRIDVTANISESMTTGEIQIPTSLDKTETTLIAAAVETIERIGPADAKVTIDRVDDIRSSKRDYVLQRAKELMGRMSSIDTREIESELISSVRAAKIIEYGEEKLPAGPDMENQEVIVVEGRADVLNLLKYGIKNVVAMEGASMPKTIKELSKERKLTMFVDGDRGGILNAKDALATTKLEFIAQAPAGKEVEELSGKELMACLRGRMPASDFLAMIEEKPARKSRGRFSEVRERGGRREFREERRYGRREYEEKPQEVEEQEAKELNNDDIEKLREMMSDIEGTRSVLILDSDLRVMRKGSANDLSYALGNLRGKVFAIIYDGVVTNIIIRIAERTPCKYIIAKNFAVNQETRINLISV